MPDLPHELAVWRELQKLGGGGGIGWPGAVPAREHENVALLVDSHAGGLAQEQVRRKLKEVRHGVERDFRDRCLREGMGRNEKEHR